MAIKKETTLLDSSLNTATGLSVPICKSYIDYNIKVLDLQGFKQVYIYPKRKSHLISGFEKNSKLYNLDIDSLFDKSKTTPIRSKNDLKIEFKNVMRSKIKLQRLAKANASIWKTFITLTFDTQIEDLSVAYKKFRSFITLTGRKYKDFAWLCVPEFQKSGRVHYHLISNIDMTNDLVYWFDNGMPGKKHFEGYCLRTWTNGFNLVEPIKDKDGNDTKKLCGYISKYMTKAYIEDCFFNKNRYYCSQNLVHPKEILIDTSYTSDIDTLTSILGSAELIYSNTYTDLFGNDIEFIEYKAI